MKLYTLGLYEKALPASLSWKEKFLLAKKYGYDYIEISIDETDAKLARLEMSREERLSLVSLMRETGVSIDSMCLSGHRKYALGSSDPTTAARSMDIMEKAILLARDLGVRIIQLAGYDVYYEPNTPATKAQFLHNLQISTNMAAKYGVMLAFETMETSFMDTVGKAMYYVDAIDSPYLHVYPDSGNLVNASKLYHTDVYQDLSCGKGHIAALHLKETVPGKYREIPFGTGHVDFDQMIEQAWNLGVRKFVTEFWYTGSPDWEADVAFAHDKMQTILDLNCRKELSPC